MKTLGIGLVGCGVVGGGVVQHLQRNGDLLADRCGARLELRRVAVRDTSKARGVDPSLVTGDWRQVVNDPKVDIVIELMGGTKTAREVAEAALKAGKPLVTANKALLADCGEALFNLAADHKTAIYFEASVAGGIPIVKALKEGLIANRILGLHGIINGTCNYILTRMNEEGLSFPEALAEAKRLGYAEADESLDVDGIDAAQKAAILASLAYGFWIRLEHVYVEGIRHVEAIDVNMARKLGYGLKLLATMKGGKDGAVEVRVHPTLVPLTHVMASIRGVFNAVAVEGDVVGQTLFYGRGAGADPTASAILSDTAEAAIELARGASCRGFFAHNLHGRVLTMDEVVVRHYVRLTVLNQPGVLAQVASIFGQNKIGISSVFQPEGHDGESIPLVLLLDQAKEADFQSAIREIQNLPVVREPARVIRVEDFS